MLWVKLMFQFMSNTAAQTYLDHISNNINIPHVIALYYLLLCCLF